MKRVLFVDDEPAMLEGLRLRLRSHRKDWEMLFAESAHAALAEMDRMPVNVLVADLRMPGMSGIDLLARAREQCPSTIRIMLSGQVDEKTVLGAISAAHRVFCKPCDTRDLMAGIERSLRLVDLVENPAALRALGALDQLPSPPGTYTALQRVLEDPNGSLDAAAEVISADSAVAARVLRYVNSACIGLNREVVDVAAAVRFLGVNSVRGLTLAAGLEQGALSGGAGSEPLLELNDHALRVAQLAAKVLPGESSFTAGILHDVGKLVWIAQQPKLWKQCCALGSGARAPSAEQEISIFGSTHGRVGACLLGLWGMPDSLVEAAAFHHNPEALNSDEFDVTGAVHVANALTQAPEQLQELLDIDYLERVGMSSQIDGWAKLPVEAQT